MINKYIFLFLILTGILVNPGCADAKSQPLTYNAPGELYMSIFFPYVGLLSPGAHNMPEGYTQYPYQDQPFSRDFTESPGQDYSRDLREATGLLDSNIKKAEETSQKIEVGIQQLQAKEEDVGRLEELYGEYTSLIEDAKRYRELSISVSGEEPVDETQVKYLVLSQNSMIQANFVLKEIFGEFQHRMLRTEQLNNSRLNAEGSGRVILVGSFTLNAHLENGVMAILGLSSDSAIYIKGDYTFEEQKEGTYNVLLYNIRYADIEIPGSSNTVLLNAEKISLEVADGKGSVTFLGNGTYTIEDANGTKRAEDWTNISLEMKAPDPGPGHGRAEAIRTEEVIKTEAHIYGPGATGTRIYGFAPLTNLIECSYKGLKSLA